MSAGSRLAAAGSATPRTERCAALLPMVTIAAVLAAGSLVNAAGGAVIPVIDSGFEDETRVGVSADGLDAGLTGVDGSRPKANNWDTYPPGMSFNFLRRGYEEASVFAIVPDPAGVSNSVLKMQVKGIGRSGRSGRAQGAFIMRQRYDHHEVRFRQFVSRDFALLRDIPATASPQWTDFFEIWTPVAPEGEEVRNPAGAFRIYFAFVPDGRGDFLWELKGQNMGGTRDEIWKGWIRRNAAVRVPFGEWTDWEVTIVKGPDPKISPGSPARVTVRMRPQGGHWNTLFHVVDERTEHSRLEQFGYYQINPFKNYLGPKTVEHLLARGATDISLYFDDFRYAVAERAP